MSEILPGLESVAGSFYYPHAKALVLPGFARPALSDANTQPLDIWTPQLKVPEWIRDEEKLKSFFTHVGQNLEEINGSLTVLEESGDSFEVAIIRSGSDNKKGVMLHISTYSSSISTNPGNGYEFAVQAALYEDFDHIYVASPGNGGSSPIKDTDAFIATPWGKMGQKEYFKKTGRTTYEENGEIKPLPFLVNLQCALERQDLGVTGFIGTDSAGGSYATGLSLAMPEGQIQSGFFSERSNVTAIGPGKLAFGMLYKENQRHAAQMRALRNPVGNDVIDPLSIYAKRIDNPTKANVTLAREKLTRKIKQVSTREKIGGMATSLAALSRGPRVWHGHELEPLKEDVNAMMAHHPGAHFTFTLAERDVLYQGRARELAQELLEGITAGRADVQAIILSAMPHAYHTALPLFQDALRRYAFGGTL